MRPAPIRVVRLLGLAAMVVAAAATSLTNRGEADTPAAGGAVHFTEHLLQDKYGYAFGLATGDLNGDRLPRRSQRRRQAGRGRVGLDRQPLRLVREPRRQEGRRMGAP